jgi:hypothetical protein
MSASATLSDLRRLGADVVLTSKGVKLRLPAGCALPDNVLAEARHQKSELRVLLEREQHDGFEERAAICEHEGGLTRDQSEILASLCTIRPPEGVTAEQVSNVVNSAALFLDEQRRSRRGAQLLTSSNRA